MPETFKSAKISAADHARVQKIADKERLTDYQAVSAALDAWERLSRKQQDQIIFLRGRRRRPQAAAPTAA